MAPNTLPVGTPTVRSRKSWDSLDQNALQQARGASGKPSHITQQVIHFVLYGSALIIALILCLFNLQTFFVFSENKSVQWMGLSNVLFGLYVK